MITYRRIGLVVVLLWFLLGGIGHFTLTDTFMRIVPPAIPWPRAAVLVSGVFELLGAIGILIPVTRRAAGVGLFLLTIAVRLLFQVVLLAIILWSTWSAPLKIQKRVDNSPARP